MAFTLNNVATTDKVSDNQIETPNAVGLSILIANAAVIANFKRVPTGHSNESSWTDDLLLTPQTAQYAGVSGFRCRSALSGTPARVVAVLSEPSDPKALGAVPYTALLSSGGGVTPGPSSVQIQKDGALIATEPIIDFLTGKGLFWTITDDVAGTRVTVQSNFLVGKVSAAGATLLGAGFTPARIGLGQYTITPTVNFASVPFVLAVANDTGAAKICQVYNVAVNVFQVNTYDATVAGAGADSAFTFLAGSY